MGQVILLVWKNNGVVAHSVKRICCQDSRGKKVVCVHFEWYKLKLGERDREEKG